MIQDKVFLKGEGDQWFERNKRVLGSRARVLNDKILYLFSKNKIRPRRVLEIGAANGWRLEVLRRRYKCFVAGVEPSLQAVKSGKRLFPKVNLKRGLSSKLPFPDTAKFDAIVVYFVFHWVDRSALLKSFSEIDRLLAGGGYLAIGDFLPAGPTKVRYHHLPKENVYTYKLDYSKPFLDSGLYRLVDKIIFNHDTGKIDRKTPLHARAVCSLLRKSQDGYYSLVKLK